MGLFEKIKKLLKVGERSERSEEDEFLLDEKSFKIAIYKTLKNIEESLRRLENKVDFKVTTKEDIELLKKDIELTVKNLKIESIETIKQEEIEKFIQNAKIDELFYLLKLIEKRLQK